LIDRIIYVGVLLQLQCFFQKYLRLFQNDSLLIQVAFFENVLDVGEVILA